jgi:hypothetical protein
MADALWCQATRCSVDLRSLAMLLWFDRFKAGGVSRAWAAHRKRWETCRMLAVVAVVFAAVRALVQVPRDV